MENSITSVQEVETAQILHTKIAAGLNLMGQGLFETCINLKKMHDGKYYKCLGYDTLEDYTLDKFDIGKRQAYTYIQAIDQLGEDFLKSNARLGITKLQLLATVPVFDRMELIEENDLEEMSVPEVKELIKKPEQITFDNTVEKPVDNTETLEKENDELKKQIENLKEQLATPKDHFEDDNLKKLKDENKKLKQQADEQKQTISAVKSSNEALNLKLKQEQENKESLREKYLSENEKLKQEIEKLKKPVNTQGDPKEVFKAYYKNILAAVSPALSFIGSIDSDKDFYAEKLKDLANVITQKAEELKND